jgi:hypothetical protein
MTLQVGNAVPSLLARAHRREDHRNGPAGRKPPRQRTRFGAVVVDTHGLPDEAELARRSAILYLPGWLAGGDPTAFGEQCRWRLDLKAADRAAGEWRVRPDERVRRKPTHLVRVDRLATAANAGAAGSYARLHRFAGAPGAGNSLPVRRVGALSTPARSRAARSQRRLPPRGGKVLRGAHLPDRPGRGWQHRRDQHPFGIGRTTGKRPQPRRARRSPATGRPRVCPGQG